MSYAVRALHALLVVLAFFPWALGCISFGLALLFTLAADWLWPDATHGNCWTYVGPRWFKHGGYILIRAADDVRVLGRGFIPHAIWVKRWPMDAEVEQTLPIKRTGARWLPWRTLYFPFKVRHSERPHNSTWGDL
jgi:hypothetical protein